MKHRTVFYKDESLYRIMQPIAQFTNGLLPMIHKAICYPAVSQGRREKEQNLQGNASKPLRIMRCGRS